MTARAWDGADEPDGPDGASTVEGPGSTEGLGVVVVSYASVDLLDRNLGRVHEGLPGARVVVVDCWSSPTQREEVTALCRARGWELVGLPDNRGFGGGVNAGVAVALRAGCRDLLLLNPDAVVGREDVALLRAAVSEQRLTLAAPVVVDGAGGLWSSGVDLDLADGSMHGVPPGAPEVTGRRRWLSGACLMLTRELWSATGGFDESYFLYWEDVDFAQRVTRAGGALVVVADAQAVHEEGGTQGPTGRAKSRQYYYYNIVNRMRYATKHLDAAGVRRWERSAPKAAYAIVLRGGRRQLLHSTAPYDAVWRGLRDGWRVSRKRGGTRHRFLDWRGRRDHP